LHELTLTILLNPDDAVRWPNRSRPTQRRILYGFMDTPWVQSMCTGGPVKQGGCQRKQAI
jgi:hypothetical protein